jgi:GTP-binding protein HflX
VQVVDASDADPFAQIAAVHEVLHDIKAGDIPELLVVNKTDLVSPETLDDLHLRLGEAYFICAKSGVGVDALRSAIEARLPQPNVLMEVILPYSRGDLLDRIHRNGEIVTQEHIGDGTKLVVRVNSDLAGELSQYVRTA